MEKLTWMNSYTGFLPGGARMGIAYCEGTRSDPGDPKQKLNVFVWGHVKSNILVYFLIQDVCGFIPLVLISNSNEENQGSASDYLIQ